MLREMSWRNRLITKATTQPRFHRVVWVAAAMRVSRSLNLKLIVDGNYYP